MARQIFDALGVMDGTVEKDEPRSLMPPRHLLELCVTVTDHFGYVRYLPIADPPVIAEGQHRHLLEFRYRSDGRNDFGPDQSGALTLAARATSSLPVGFQPVHVGTFPDVLDGDTKSEHIRPFFRAYELATRDPSWAHLVDGGVLDNKPFGPVLKAIKERPAANEVDATCSTSSRTRSHPSGRPSRRRRRGRSPRFSARSAACRGASPSSTNSTTSWSGTSTSARCGTRSRRTGPPLSSRC